MPKKPTKAKAAAKKTKPRKAPAKKKKIALAQPRAAKRAAATRTAPRPLSARAEIAKLAAKWPALAPFEIEAFESLYSDSQCDELGKRTKAVEVRSEGLRWATIMDGALRTYGGALDLYAPKRFSYYLHVLLALADEITGAEGRHKEVGPIRTHAENARALALAARKEMLGRLLTFAGGRAAEREQIAEATGEIETNEGLVRSLRALLHLELDWLERTDPASRVLAAGAGLSEQKAEELRAHAAALSTRALDSVRSSALRKTDTPAVNRIEGRILLEMREARRIFNAAHDLNPVVPRLQSGPSLRFVFGA